VRFHAPATVVLALAASHGYRRLVLGAWGCGVFRNEPEVVAAAFAELLCGIWNSRFEQVLFAVYDPSPTQAIFWALRRHLLPDA
jgi:uncharacterized protein (TIGR02452 family)